jgi:hypothetical protein
MVKLNSPARERGANDHPSDHAQNKSQKKIDEDHDGFLGTDFLGTDFLSGSPGWKRSGGA